MQGIAERFAKAAEELRLTGRQLYRDGIVANDQVLSKIKNGWQKPTKKAIELFCQKYGVSAAWLYTGEGNQYLGRSKPFEPRVDAGDCSKQSRNCYKPSNPESRILSAMAVFNFISNTRQPINDPSRVPAYQNMRKVDGFCDFTVRSALPLATNGTQEASS